MSGAGAAVRTVKAATFRSENVSPLTAASPSLSAVADGSRRPIHS
jgi:hypothetical protein